MRADMMDGTLQVDGSACKWIKEQQEDTNNKWQNLFRKSRLRAWWVHFSQKTPI